MNYLHQPVMLSEALRYLDPVPGDVICDATCGGGGHSLEIARLIGESGVLIGIDRDPQALAAAGKKLEGAPLSRDTGTWELWRHGSSAFRGRLPKPRRGPV